MCFLLQSLVSRPPWDDVLRSRASDRETPGVPEATDCAPETQGRQLTASRPGAVRSLSQRCHRGEHCVLLTSRLTLKVSITKENVQQRCRTDKADECKIMNSRYRNNTMKAQFLRPLTWSRADRGQTAAPPPLCRAQQTPPPPPPTSWSADQDPALPRGQAELGTGHCTCCSVSKARPVPFRQELAWRHQSGVAAPAVPPRPGSVQSHYVLPKCPAPSAHSGLHVTAGTWSLSPYCHFACYPLTVRLRTRVNHRSPFGGADGSAGFRTSPPDSWCPSAE